MALRAVANEGRQPSADVVGLEAGRASRAAVGLPAGRRPVVIRDLATLRALLRRPQAVRRGATYPVVLDIPGVMPGERETWRAALDAYRHDCGCSTGGAFSVLTIAIMLAWRVWVLTRAGPVTAWPMIVALVVALGAGILMGGIGKAVGLARARARFRRALARLVARIGERSPDAA